MLKTDRVQNLIHDLTKHSAHDRQNLEANNDVNFVFFFFVIDLRIEFFVVVVVVVSSSAFIVSIVSFFVKLITISLDIKLFTMLARCVILFFADNAHFDDDNENVFDF